MKIDPKDIKIGQFIRVPIQNARLNNDGSIPFSRGIITGITSYFVPIIYYSMPKSTSLYNAASFLGDVYADYYGNLCNEFKEYLSTTSIERIRLSMSLDTYAGLMNDVIDCKILSTKQNQKNTSIIGELLEVNSNTILNGFVQIPLTSLDEYGMIAQNPFYFTIRINLDDGLSLGKVIFKG